MIEVVGSISLKGYKKSLKHFLEGVLRRENRNRFKKIYIILANDRKMRLLNRKFLYKDRTTDVLSFEIGKIAEIYVNVDYAKKLGDFSYYLAFYSLHGLLHVLGYDHKVKTKEEEMLRVQDEYMKLWKF